MADISPDQRNQIVTIQDDNGNDAIGEVSATPTANTVNARLKDVYDRQSDRTAKVQITDGERDMKVAFSGFDNLKVANETQIFEEGFSQGLDTEEIWNEIEVGTGSVSVVDSEGIMTVSALSDEATIQTKIPHQFLHGFSTTWRMRGHLNNTGEIGNVREWGPMDDQNGYGFKLDGTTFSAVIRRKGVDTLIDQSAFVEPFTLDANTHTYEIQYLNGNKVVFYVDNVFRHQAVSGANNLIAKSNVPSRVHNLNSTATGTNIITMFGLAVVRDGAPFGFDTIGRLRVTSGVVEAPPGTAEILVGGRKNLSPNQVIDETHTITNGLTVTLQVLKARVESAGTGKSVIATIYSDPLGVNAAPPGSVPASWVEIDTVMGNNFNIDAVQTKSLSGDGTARVVLRTEQVGSASMICFTSFQGFEQ